MHNYRRIYIIGFMGSGKSTAGKILAAALKWSFIDLDTEIENKAGKTINEIFSGSGEDFFRDLEAKVLHSIDIKNDTVISVGGGTPCFLDNLDFMKRSGIVIYLKMSPEQLISRLSGEASKRPLLKDIDKEDLDKYIKQKLTVREEYYNKAHIIADGFNLNIQTLTVRLDNLMQKRKPNGFPRSVQQG